MKSIVTYLAISALSICVSTEAVAASRVAPSGATQAHAAQPKMLGPSSTGQPNQTCGSASGTQHAG